MTSPDNHPTFTNLSDPSKTLTISNTGPAKVYTDENGNLVVQIFGRSALFDPSFGLKLFIGQWNFVVDQNGNIIQGPTGTGQIIDICELIQ